MPHYLQSITRLSFHTVGGMTSVRRSNWVVQWAAEGSIPGKDFLLPILPDQF